MRDFLASDAAFVKAEILKLKYAFPEMADDADLLRDMIEGSTDFEKVITRTINMALESEALDDGLKGYIDTIKLRRTRLQAKAETLRGIALGLMQAAQQTKLTLPVATINITKPRISVVVDDLDLLPQGYFKTEKIAMKTEIKATLEAGEEVPGARLETGFPTLTVRTK